MRTTIFIYILLLSFKCVFGQNIDLEKDISILNKNIRKLLARSNCFENISELEMLHIVFMEYEGDFLKKNFTEKSFLKKLKPSFFIQTSFFKKKQYLQTDTYIYNKKSKILIAISDGRQIFCLQNYADSAFATEKLILNKALEKEIDFIFYINKTPVNTFFTIKDKTIFVFETNYSKVNIHTLEQFVNCCWDKFTLMD